MEDRVVITGLNIITSLGLDINKSWENLLSGKSGIKKISLFDPSNMETKIAGEVSPEFEEYSKNYIKKRLRDQMTRATRMCYVCASEAIDNSSIDFDSQDSTRCAVILGVVGTGKPFTKNSEAPKNKIVRGMNNAMSAWISLKYKLEGSNFTVSTACASSAYAIGLGYDMIKLKKADIVIVGGADSTINEEEIKGFNDLYALSTQNEKPEKASCPFSLNRDGFVIGEGAGILILESLEHAKKRGAKIHAEMAGYATLNEAFNIMAPKENGEGMLKTMETALSSSGVSPEMIDYINAHGTSTTLNDKYETMAIKKLFGERAYKIPVSSSKSMIGHTIGAAGAIEAAITIKSMQESRLTPTINYNNPDPELDLDYVPNESRKHDINYALSNSFAFGGHNASIIFKKYI